MLGLPGTLEHLDLFSKVQELWLSSEINIFELLGL